MFGWRRKNEGFEWSKYVRTTIKIRREERAKKIDEIKQAAAAGAKAAGRKGIVAGRHGTWAIGAGLIKGAKLLWAGMVSSARHAGRAVVSILSMSRRGVELSLMRLPARAKIAAMFGSLGLLAGLSFYLQYQQSGVSWSAMLAGFVGIALIGLAVAPWLRRLLERVAGSMKFGVVNWAMPRVGPMMPSFRWVGAAVVLLVACGAGLWTWQSGALATGASSILSALPNVPSFSTNKPVKKLPKISGAGRAISGDTIRINGRLVRLAGIEAPEISQVCKIKSGRRWRCGRRARSILRRIIRRAKLVCKDVTRIEGGRFKATCGIGDRDVAGSVVKLGYAFAQGMIFKTYAQAEAEAREARRGIWQGAAERPSDFRAKRWEVARKSAPNGCPIKGRVVRKTKIYVLPWATEYRRVRVRSRRGERWFCSEAEATSAGFKPSSTG